MESSLGMSLVGARFIPSMSSTKATELDLIRVFWGKLINNTPRFEIKNKEWHVLQSKKALRDFHLDQRRRGCCLECSHRGR